MHVITLRTPGNTGSEESAFALDRKGFRLFFLLAAGFACLGVPLWLLALRGAVSPGGLDGPRSWHSHEMIFGYAVAVIAGFLLTAIEKWTDRPTIGGPGLIALGGLWILGRGAWWGAGALPPLLVAAVDVVFLPALTWICARPIVATRNRRNYGVVAMLVFLSLANLVTHLEVLGIVSGWRFIVNAFALDVITVMMLLIGFRVIPMFTRNATRSPHVVTSVLWSRVTLSFAVALSFATLIQAPRFWIAGLALGAALSSLLAAAKWGTRETLRYPMLWILHAGYFWITVSLILRGLSASGLPVSPSAALHALTVGGLGALTIGMMSRVSLGHTGRQIVSSTSTSLSFALILLAALVRVALPELEPSWVLASWQWSGVLWAAAFAAFLWRFGPVLCSPRVDGQPG